MNFNLKTPGVLNSDEERHIQRSSNASPGDGIQIFPDSSISPLSYANLLFWANPTSYSNTGGGFCNNVVDKSGNSRNLTVANAPGFPVYQASALNGLAGVGELAADEGINGVYSLGGFTGLTCYTVSRRSCFGLGIVASPCFGFGVFNADGKCYSLLGDNSTHFSSYASSEVTFTTKVGVYDGSQAGNARYVMFVNGSSQALSYTGTPPASIASTGTISIGNIGGDPYRGIMVECFIYNAIHDTTTRNALELYLKNKYAHY